jgi:hypothetical protein
MSSEKTAIGGCHFFGSTRKTSTGSLEVNFPS